MCCCVLTVAFKRQESVPGADISDPPRFSVGQEGLASPPGVRLLRGHLDRGSRVTFSLGLFLRGIWACHLLRIHVS